jgi:hypothetical protein
MRGRVGKEGSSMQEYRKEQRELERQTTFKFKDSRECIDASRRAAAEE